MTIDISKIKPGDKVTLVPLEVANVYGRVFTVFTKRGGATFAPDEIAAHHPAPREIGVGDRVKHPDWKHTLVVEHISKKGFAWLTGGDVDLLSSMSILTIVEGDHERA
jgi:hypothetical protein